MIENARRQPVATTSAASGTVPTRAPETPTVAETADIVANCEGGNQLAAILRQPMKVTAAPSPTRKRPPKGAAWLSAKPMASEPRPMTAAPAVYTRRTPKLSSSSPAGIMKPA